MQPLYNGFNAFKGTDSKAINEAIALAILNAASGKSSLELKSPIILDQIWKAVIPLFDKFYGQLVMSLKGQSISSRFLVFRWS